jgi:hypothetical protein
MALTAVIPLVRSVYVWKKKHKNKQNENKNKTKQNKHKTKKKKQLRKLLLLDSQFHFAAFCNIKGTVKSQSKISSIKSEYSDGLKE